MDTFAVVLTGVAMLFVLLVFIFVAWFVWKRDRY